MVQVGQCYILVNDGGDSTHHADTRACPGEPRFADCPWHHSQHDIRTGKISTLARLSSECSPQLHQQLCPCTYPVRVVNEDVQVGVRKL